jgi:hypothetical protein
MRRGRDDLRDEGRRRHDFHGRLGPRGYRLWCDVFDNRLEHRFDNGIRLRQGRRARDIRVECGDGRGRIVRRRSDLRGAGRLERFRIVADRHVEAGDGGLRRIVCVGLGQGAERNGRRPIRDDPARFFGLLEHSLRLARNCFADECRERRAAAGKSHLRTDDVAQVFERRRGCRIGAPLGHRQRASQELFEARGKGPAAPDLRDLDDVGERRGKAVGKFVRAERAAEDEHQRARHGLADVGARVEPGGARSGRHRHSEFGPEALSRELQPLDGFTIDGFEQDDLP